MINCVFRVYIWKCIKKDNETLTWCPFCPDGGKYHENSLFIDVRGNKSKKCDTCREKQRNNDNNRTRTTVSKFDKQYDAIKKSQMSEADKASHIKKLLLESIDSFSNINDNAPCPVELEQQISDSVISSGNEQNVVNRIKIPTVTSTSTSTLVPTHLTNECRNLTYAEKRQICRQKEREKMGDEEYKKKLAEEQRVYRANKKLQMDVIIPCGRPRVNRTPEEKREYERLRKQKQREKQKQSLNT
jgi:hypothetical protein